jgi:hypothetical protein
MAKIICRIRSGKCHIVAMAGEPMATQADLEALD